MLSPTWHQSGICKHRIQCEHVAKVLAKTDILVDQIQLVSIPDGIENLEDRNVLGKLTEAMLRDMPMKLEELIEQTNESDSNTITCVLADQSLGWALEVSEKMGIRCAAFCPAAAALLIMGFNIPKLIEDGIIDNNDETSLSLFNVLQ